MSLFQALNICILNWNAGQIQQLVRPVVNTEVSEANCAVICQANDTTRPDQLGQTDLRWTQNE